MKQQPLLFCTLILMMMAAASCKKGDGAAIKSADAIVLNTGPTAADGCGWLIKTTADDSIYSAVNLTSQYQMDSLKVHITYHKLATRYYCGDIVRTLDPGITEIQLNTITKAN